MTTKKEVKMFRFISVFTVLVIGFSYMAFGGGVVTGGIIKPSTDSFVIFQPTELIDKITQGSFAHKDMNIYALQKKNFKDFISECFENSGEFENLTIQELADSLASEVKSLGLFGDSIMLNDYFLKALMEGFKASPKTPLAFRWRDTKDHQSFTFDSLSSSQDPQSHSWSRWGAIQQHIIDSSGELPSLWFTQNQGLFSDFMLSLLESHNSENIPKSEVTSEINKRKCQNMKVLLGH